MNILIGIDPHRSAHFIPLFDSFVLFHPVLLATTLSVAFLDCIWSDSFWNLTKLKLYDMYRFSSTYRACYLV